MDLGMIPLCGSPLLYLNPIKNLSSVPREKIFTFHCECFASTRLAVCQNRRVVSLRNIYNLYKIVSTSNIDITECLAVDS
jgi:hypothetical protein